MYVTKPAFLSMSVRHAQVSIVLKRTVEVRLRHAVIGGIAAAVLWELVRNFLVWWFSSISLVNVVYGSLATVVVVLLSLESAAIILLLGAQVIAELEPESKGAPEIG